MRTEPTRALNSSKDAAGNLYGTTYNGGDADSGVVFKLTKVRKKYKYSRLHSFCSEANCADGDHPFGKLVIDVSGNLYGTATGSGPNGGGAVFELVNQKDYKVIYAPCGQKNCKDGRDTTALSYQGQASGALYDGTSPLFGSNAVANGGRNGTLFRLDTDGSRWKMTTLYTFCKRDCDAGDVPIGDLLIDGSGNIYGTTQYFWGTLFKFDTAGHAALLHRFCSLDACRDGGSSMGGVVMDAAGVVYGTTNFGGAEGSDNGGVAFKYDPVSGYSVTGDFTPENGGIEPIGTPVMDAHGTLFGVTSFGGPNLGSIFEIKHGKPATLFEFCGFEQCGSSPDAGLIIDSAGTLYGTTEHGGIHDTGDEDVGGTVFQFTP